MYIYLKKMTNPWVNIVFLLNHGQDVYNLMALEVFKTDSQQVQNWSGQLFAGCCHVSFPQASVLARFFNAWRLLILSTLSSKKG